MLRKFVLGSSMLALTAFSIPKGVVAAAQREKAGEKN
jgi:hypothetical protein